MTPQDLRSKKYGVVVKPTSRDDVFNHPLVTATPNGLIIAMLAMNGLLEELAQELESAPITHAEDAQ